MNDAASIHKGLPDLERQVRFATNFLSAARQMEVISGITAAEVATPTVLRGAGHQLHGAGQSRAKHRCFP
jgi:hypothetical protein